MTVQQLLDFLGHQGFEGPGLPKKPHEVGYLGLRSLLHFMEVLAASHLQVGDGDCQFAKVLGINALEVLFLEFLG